MATTTTVKRTADGGNADANKENNDVVKDNNLTRMIGSQWAASGRVEALERCATHPRQQSTNVDNLGGIDEREGQYQGDGTTEKCRGGGNWVVAFELHSINSKPTFRPPRCRKRTGTYFANILGVTLRYWRHREIIQ